MSTTAGLPGFTVMYRWRLREGSEPAFREAWEAVTRALMKERGALGSRLHRAEDGTWTAYAQWPSRAAWARSREAEPVDARAALIMSEAIEESFPPILMTPVADYLVPSR